jgi:hypothetical protein
MRLVQPSNKYCRPAGRSYKGSRIEDLPGKLDADKAAEIRDTLLTTKVSK